MATPKAELTPQWVRRPNSQGYSGYRQSAQLAGPNGSRMSIFGRAADDFAGFGEFVVVGPGDLAFQNSWTYDDWNSANKKWLNHIDYWFKLKYVPLPPSVITAAKNKFNALQTQLNAGDVAAGALLEKLLLPIRRGIADGDSNTSQFDNLGNASDATHRARFELFTALNKAIQDLANVTLPKFVKGGTADASDPFAVVVQQNQEAAAEAKRQQAVAQAQDAQAKQIALDAKSAMLKAKGGGSNTMLIAGGGALVLGLAAVLLLKKKKPAQMSGYTRRTRRNRR